MLPFKLFQSKQILGLCFASFPVFWSDTDNWTFVWLSYPMLLTDFLSFLVVLIPDKPSTFVLLLCILQGLHPSGFSLCITRIKNLFFWKEIDKTFCCFRYSVICNLLLITSLLLLISCFYVKLVKLKSDFIYRMLARGCYFYQLPFLIRSNLYTNV